ncbi:MAG: hypothetical protein JST12_00545 [Armatimonadetes bacterium]|nr:hypothetical protein [Armatimonadota bacterium]
MKEIASVSLHWKWVGAGVAPTKVWIRLSATADSKAKPTVGSTNLTVDNGLGSPVLDVDDGDGTIHKVCTGTKLVELSTSGNDLEIPFSATAVASSTSAYSPYTNSCSAKVTYSATLKGIRLLNRATYQKAGLGWTKILSGPSETHTVWDEAMVFDENGQSARVFGRYETFTAEKDGLWVDPFHTWMSDWLTWTDDFFNERDTQEMGFLVPTDTAKTVPDNGPYTVTAYLKVKDLAESEDHTELTDSHKVFIYAPLMHSNIYHVGIDTFITPDNFTVEPPGHSLDGGGIHCTWEETQILWDIFGYLTSSAEVESLFAEEPWLALVAKVMSEVTADYKPKPNGGDAPWAWGWPGSTYDGSYTPPFDAPPNQSQYGAVFQNWSMTPKFEVKYTQQFTEAEGYDDSGYYGRVTSLGYKDTGARWSGDFHSTGSGSDGGQNSNPGA